MVKMSMKVFHCDHCQQLVFFENIQCMNCDHALAYVPNLADMKSLEKVGQNLWKFRGENWQQTYRLCANYSQENVCNWAISNDDPHPLCKSCRLTRVIPDLYVQGNKEAWYKLEVAKRRLVYSLLYLDLPVTNRADDPQRGLAFEFLADMFPPNYSGDSPAPVLTGHSNGVITINVAEADDAERERRRMQLHEPYRTLLGHFRHEMGHYYWDRLIKDSSDLNGFRQQFGDERADYGQALQNHYQCGPPPDWQMNFVTAYASSHPWEDWAETWAHYLHMVDTLETASACGLSLRPKRQDEPSMKSTPEPKGQSKRSFDDLIESWFPLTYALNNLSRGLGQPDAYPFVLSRPAVAKLQFIHEVINEGTR